MNIILGTPGTCSLSHLLLHPQPPSPASVGSHSFRSEVCWWQHLCPHPESHVQAQLCPCPAPALSSLRVQLGQSRKNFQCSPQLVPPKPWPWRPDSPLDPPRAGPHCQFWVIPGRTGHLRQPKFGKQLVILGDKNKPYRKGVLCS